MTSNYYVLGNSAALDFCEDSEIIDLCDKYNAFKPVDWRKKVEVLCDFGLLGNLTVKTSMDISGKSYSVGFDDKPTWEVLAERIRYAVKYLAKKDIARQLSELEGKIDGLPKKDQQKITNGEMERVIELIEKDPAEFVPYPNITHSIWPDLEYPYLVNEPCEAIRVEEIREVTERVTRAYYFDKLKKRYLDKRRDNIDLKDLKALLYDERIKSLSLVGKKAITPKKDYSTTTLQDLWNVKNGLTFERFRGRLEDQQLIVNGEWSGAVVKAAALMHLLVTNGYVNTKLNNKDRIKVFNRTFGCNIKDTNVTEFGKTFWKNKDVSEYDNIFS